MALSIKDDRADDLARRLAELTGESLTTVVRTALTERLEREERRRGLAERTARLLDIGRRVARLKEPTAHSGDHAELLYDEHGMPR